MLDITPKNMSEQTTNTCVTTRARATRPSRRLPERAPPSRSTALNSVLATRDETTAPSTAIASVTNAQVATSAGRSKPHTHQNARLPSSFSCAHALIASSPIRGDGHGHRAARGRTATMLSHMLCIISRPRDAPERQPHGCLLRALIGAGEEEIHDVDAGQQENQRREEIDDGEYERSLVADLRHRKRTHDDALHSRARRSRFRSSALSRRARAAPPTASRPRRADAVGKTAVDVGCPRSGRGRRQHVGRHWHPGVRRHWKLEMFGRHPNDPRTRPFNVTTRPTIVVSLANTTRQTRWLRTMTGSAPTPGRRSEGATEQRPRVGEVEHIRFDHGRVDHALMSLVADDESSARECADCASGRDRWPHRGEIDHVERREPNLDRLLMLTIRSPPASGSGFTTAVYRNEKVKIESPSPPPSTATVRAVKSGLRRRMRRA